MIGVREGFKALARRHSICGGGSRATGQQFIQNRDIRAVRFHEVHAQRR